MFYFYLNYNISKLNNNDISIRILISNREVYDFVEQVTRRAYYIYL
ncbi:hypothetical protein BAFK78_G011 (plasmid) [Borreliella afzelii K78]|nr:hypothetical protein BAFK78_G011 [Borreliella afzelii K78]